METLIGFIIVLILCAFIAVLHIRDRKEWAVILTMVSLCVVPVIKILPVDVNGTYLITLTLGLLFLRDWFTKRISFKDINRNVKIYVSFMLAILFVYTIAWFVNGKPSPSGLITLAGYLNYISCLVILVTMIDRISNDKVRKTFFTFLLIVALVNFVFVTIQAYFPKLGIDITTTLYGSEHRSTPLSYVVQLGRFTRLYGTFFSPILLGGLCLLGAGLLYSLYAENNSIRNYLILGTFVAFIGILSLTKTLLLGIPVVTVGLFCLILFTNKGERLDFFKRLLVVLLCIIVAYVGGYIFTPKNNKVFARHYYSYIMKPVESLLSRYGGIIDNNDDAKPAPDDEEYKQEEDEKEPTGITEKAFSVFKRNWLIGVGYNAVNGEFIGDSFYMEILHHGGVLGFLIYASLFCYLFFTALLKQHFDKVVILVAFAICCLSMPIINYPISMPFFAYVLKNKGDKEPA